MSEQENLHIVQRIYQAIVEGDIPTRLSLVTDDFDLTFFGSERFAGLADGAEKMGSVDSSARSPTHSSFKFSHRMNSWRPAGNNVVVLGHERCRVRATGKVVDASWAHVWTVQGGLICRRLEYSDTTAWEAGFDALGV